MKQESTHNTLLARWLEGKISDSEAREIEQIEGLDALKDFLAEVENEALPPMDMQKAWEQLAQKTVNAPTVTIKTKHKRLFPTVLRVAAAIALIVGIGLGYTWFSASYHFVTEKGQTAVHLLPDGSEVTMNAGSSISFSKWQWRYHRRVNLNGEAFFRVAKGSKFTVHTPMGDASVLGTRFDVRARKNSFQVIVFEGKVQVHSGDFLKILTKGNGVNVENGTAKSVVVKTEMPGWMAGNTQFSEASLAGVFEEIERIFNLDIQTKNVDLNRRFTGRIPNNNLNIALSTVCGAMNLKYQIADDNKTIQISSPD